MREETGVGDGIWWKKIKEKEGGGSDNSNGKARIRYSIEGRRQERTIG
jgi:hypothetical protein